MIKQVLLHLAFMFVLSVYRAFCIPAFAGMTSRLRRKLSHSRDSCEGGNPWRNKISHITVALLTCLSFFSIPNVKAAPGDISHMPLGIQGQLPPNLMLLFDSSGSMKDSVYVSCMPTIECERQSDFCLNDSCSNNGIDWSDRSTYYIGETARVSTRGSNAEYFYGDRVYKGCSTIPVAERQERTCRSTKHYEAQLSAKNLVDSIDGVYLGIMRFYSQNNEGGQILETLELLDSERADYVQKKNQFHQTLDNMAATSSTPLSESLSGIGYYYSYNTPAKPIRTPSTDLVMTLDSDDPSYVFEPTPKSDPEYDLLPASLFGNGILRKLNRLQYPTYDSGGANEAEKNANMAIRGWCQRNFAITLSDGQPTRDETITDTLNEYEDTSSSNALDDVAGALWDMDLRPDLCDLTLIEELNEELGLTMDTTDCSELINTPVTLADGSSGSVYQLLEQRVEQTADDNIVVNDGLLRRYKNNVRSYMVGFGDTDDIDEVLMQRAARLGAGKYYFAENGAQLTSVFTEILNHIGSSEASASGIGLNFAGGQQDFLYTSRFNASDWTGDLMKFPIERIVGELRLDDKDAEWATDDAGTFKSHTQRVIVTYDKDSDTGGVPLQWGTLPASIKQDLAIGPNGIADTNGQARLNYLRGDQSNEVGASSSAIGFRARTSILGDIVHSAPSYVGKIAAGQNYYTDGGPDANLVSWWNYSVDQFTGVSGSGYASPARANDVVYVNANDGMLHAFLDTTDASGSGKVEEIFAYMPSYIASSEHRKGLHYLTDPNYQHRFYNDATAWIKEDVYINNQWRTILVMGVGAGGKGISVLDITDIHNGTVSESDAAAIVLFEFTHPELGYTYAEPYVGPMRDGTWRIVMGNGYDSTSGQAGVFLIDIEDPTNYKFIQTPVELDNTEDGYGKNGMSTVVAADVYQDPERCSDSKPGLHHIIAESCHTREGTTGGKPEEYYVDHFFTGYGSIDRLYGGDLYGNMWAINLISTNTDHWQADFGTTPLFSVPKVNGVPQPITAPPRLAWAGPIIMRCDGYMKSLLNLNQNPSSFKPTIEVTGAEFGNKAVTPYANWDESWVEIPDSVTTDANGYTEAARRGLSCGPNIMVTFGTGQFLTNEDVSDTTKRAFYAVWDNYKVAATDYPLTPTDLDKREFTTTVTDTGELTRTIADSDKLADGEFKNTQWHITDEYGWYVDFDVPGERVTFSPLLLKKTNEIMFATTIPDAQQCGASGSTILNRMDVMTGVASKDYRAVRSLPDGVIVGQRLDHLSTSLTMIGKDALTGDEFVFSDNEKGGGTSTKVSVADEEARGIITWYELEL